MENFASGHALRVLLLVFVLCLGSWGPLTSNFFSSPSLPTFLSGQAGQKHPASVRPSISDWGSDPYSTPNKRSRILHSISDNDLAVDHISPEAENYVHGRLEMKRASCSHQIRSTLTTSDPDPLVAKEMTTSESANKSELSIVMDIDIPTVRLPNDVIGL